MSKSIKQIKLEQFMSLYLPSDLFSGKKTDKLDSTK